MPATESGLRVLLLGLRPDLVASCVSVFHGAEVVVLPGTSAESNFLPMVARFAPNVLVCEPSFLVHLDDANETNETVHRFEDPRGAGSTVAGGPETTALESRTQGRAADCGCANSEPYRPRPRIVAPAFQRADES